MRLKKYLMLTKAAFIQSKSETVKQYCEIILQFKTIFYCNIFKKCDDILEAEF